MSWTFIKTRKSTQLYGIDPELLYVLLLSICDCSSIFDLWIGCTHQLRYQAQTKRLPLIPVVEVQNYDAVIQNQNQRGVFKLLQFKT